MAAGGRPWCNGLMRLTRSHRTRILAGVCAGIADYFHTSPWLVRLLFLASCLLPGPQVLVYLILWIVLPWDYQAQTGARR